MRYYEVITGKRSAGDSSTLTYSSDESIPKGSVVVAPFGKTKAFGIVIAETNKPKFVTKPVAEVLYPAAISDELIELTKWIAAYYSSPLSSLVQVLLPSGANKQRRKEEKPNDEMKLDVSSKKLTDAQAQAVSKLSLSKSGSKILYGATGSGKTQVYIELIKQCHKNKKSAIVLIPEIALTSQLIATLSEAFNDIVLTHSKMTEAQRHKAWEDVASQPTERVIVGPRSALFLPVKDLGLIIVDEFHDSAYKQEQTPKYSTVRVASQYARIANATTVFGSATPSVEDFYLAQEKQAPLALIPEPVHGKRNVDIELVDMGENDNKSKNRLFSKQLLKVIDENMAKNQQTLLFHNRRGTASMAICESCGYIFECPNCSTQLTLHADKFELRCHTCNFSAKVPSSCPECKHHTILFKGFGTKEIESATKSLFPKARVARFDTDTPTKQSLANRYDELAAGKIDIIVGTQMIAKGLDLPKLHAVGIILADSGLHVPDYTASESTFQLIHQVTGRVGRRKRQDKVIIQTYNPNHPAIRFGAGQDFDSFYEYEIKQRQNNAYPPFAHLLNLTCSYAKSETAKNAGIELAKTLTSDYPDVVVLGPAPSFYAKRGSKFRWHIVVKSKARATLAEIAKNAPANWQSDLDPSTLL